ncbi:alpha/beta hydrolase [Actinomyces bowdenii]|uniref:alpha/beta hydrolase family protein n=1 Tax=Actinomyces bowdenii TaxID=131109 RepID=UPI001ABC183A|nr:alpha/beta hydrolase [Actinomyces bowdenii]
MTHHDSGGLSAAASRRAVVGGLGALGAAALLTACGASRTPVPLATTGAPGTAGPPASPGTPRPTSSDLPTREPTALDTSALPTVEYRGHDLAVDSQGESLAGRLYLPATSAGRPCPLVIISHGLGGAMGDHDRLAQVLAGLGLASYCTSFRGGGPGSGEMTRMSVMTEAADLEAVLAQARSGAGPWQGIDPQRIVLHGVSQGGLVSAIVAQRRPGEVMALELWYPAFSLPDTLRSLFGSLDEVPETYTFGRVSLGRVYAEDIWDYDPYADMPGYPSPVLIVHGAKDGSVPLGHSQRAVRTFPDAELVVLPEAGHGFSGTDWDLATGSTIAHLQRLGLIAA